MPAYVSGQSVVRKSWKFVQDVGAAGGAGGAPFVVGRSAACATAASARLAPPAIRIDFRKFISRPTCSSPGPRPCDRFVTRLLQPEVDSLILTRKPHFRE